MKPVTKRLAQHLPLLIAVLIVLVASLDIELFHPLKTEYSFGYWVVILMPLAVLLAIVQVWIWIVMLIRRLARRK